MNVKELRSLLDNFDDDTEVVFKGHDSKVRSIECWFIRDAFVSKKTKTYTYYEMPSKIFDGEKVLFLC
jgi:hypothetical protein